jgi:segregation and condensation protein B
MNDANEQLLSAEIDEDVYDGDNDDAIEVIGASAAANIDVDANINTTASIGEDINVNATASNDEDTNVMAVASKKDDLYGPIEAMLFVSDEPLSVQTLEKFLQREATDIKQALRELSLRFEDEERGIQLREVAGGWKLFTHPAYHELLESYVLSWDTRTLSQAALEALAVIAYHQPATRAVVNSIRGVNSEGVVSSLLEKGLVRECGRDAAQGNAILYATTRTFLEKFGLKSLRDLPPLEDFAADEESKDFIRARLGASRVRENTFSSDYDDGLNEID